MSENVGKCQKMSENVGKCRKMSENVGNSGKCRKMSENVGKCRKQRNMSEYVGICRNMSEYVGICRNMSEYFMSLCAISTGSVLSKCCRLPWHISLSHASKDPCGPTVSCFCSVRSFCSRTLELGILENSCVRGLRCPLSIRYHTPWNLPSYMGRIFIHVWHMIVYVFSIRVGEWDYRSSWLSVSCSRLHLS